MLNDFMLAQDEVQVKLQDLEAPYFHLWQGPLDNCVVNQIIPLPHLD